MQRDRVKRALILLLIIVAGWNLGHAAYIEAKAQLAQVLLKQAWEETLRGAEKAKPWSWADTWPVARLRQKRLNIDQIVLAGATGRTLAFGPGYLLGSTFPGAAGHSVISGHRDTHFAFLRDLNIGDQLELISREGKVLRYAVYQREIVHQNDLSLLQLDDRRLSLITCYPFDSVAPGTEQRLVVSARPVVM